MIETALVTILMQGGMTHKAALRFERVVDDLQLARGGADGLAAVLWAWQGTEARSLLVRLDQAESMCDLLMGKTRSPMIAGEEGKATG